MSRLRRLASLPPDSFSVVMATGIVSIAAFDNGYTAISYVLAAAAVAVFVALVVLIGIRLRRHLQFLAGDLREPSQVFGLFTFVAACDVLDARFGLSFREIGLLVGLGGAALAAWLILVPLTWSALRVTPRRELRRRARGSWLLAAVGTHSLAIIAGELSSLVALPALPVLAFAWWVVGVVIYLGICALITARAIRDPIQPEDVTPDSWVLMGAVAIAALAGATLVSAARPVASLHWLEGMMVPATLAVWALATAWIPALIAGEVWRLRRVRGPLRYERGRWATVFPLGMYAAGSYALAQMLSHGRALEVLSAVFFWAAFIAWCAASYGLARGGYRALRW